MARHWPRTTRSSVARYCPVHIAWRFFFLREQQFFGYATRIPPRLSSLLAGSPCIMWSLIIAINGEYRQHIPIFSGQEFIALVHAEFTLRLSSFFTNCNRCSLIRRCSSMCNIHIGRNWSPRASLEQLISDAEPTPSLHGTG